MVLRKGKIFKMTNIERELKILEIKINFKKGAIKELLKQQEFEFSLKRQLEIKRRRKELESLAIKYGELRGEI